MTRKATSPGGESPAASGSIISRFKGISFESLLLGFSSTFINLPPDRVDSEIEHWLGRVLEFLEIDGSVIIQQASPDDPLAITHLKIRPARPEMVRNLKVNEFSWIAGKLLHGEMITFSGSQELPAEAVHDIALLSKNGINSFVGIPFASTGRALSGAILFGNVERVENWDAQTTRRLWLVSQVFANALLRKLTEEELHLRNAAIESANDGILLVDAKADDHPITNASPSFCRLTGYSAQEILGRNCRFLQGPDTDPTVVADIRNAIRQERSFMGEILNYRKDGTSFWNLLRIAPIRNASGELTHFVGIQTDITDRLKAEDDAKNLRSQLFRVSRISTMGELTASIAHELNQPLSAILSNAQAALRFLDSPKPDLVEVKAALADIVVEDQRAGNVIRHLRALLEGHELETIPLSINQVIEEVLSLVRGELNTNKIRLNLDLGKNLPLIRGDRIQLQQVILNLVINAIEAMMDQDEFARELKVRTSLSGDNTVASSFHDTGQGIDPSTADTIFDSFVTTKKHGMGMGLSICNSIIEAHGGKLSGRNRQNGGATFQFTLPLARKTAEHKTTSRAVEQSSMR